MRALSFTLIISSLYLTSVGQDFDKTAIALNNQASELMVLGAYNDSALILLDKAIEIEPDYHVAYGNRANIFVQKRDFPKAIESMQKSVLAKPDLAEGVCMLAMLYDHVGQEKLATLNYRKAIEIYDARLESHDKLKLSNEMNRAWTFVLLGETEKGMKELKGLLIKNPGDMTLNMFVNLKKQEFLENMFGKH